MAPLEITDMTSTLDRSKLGMNRPECLVVHSTRSYPKFDDLLAFHRKRGFAGVGYHFFVSSSGMVCQARPIGLEGAHALGFNRKSVGICVYSKDGSLSTGTIQTCKELILYIKEEAGVQAVLSHTSAQLLRINELLEKEGLPDRFEIDEEVTEDRAFTEMKLRLQKFLEEKPDCGEEARRIITGFKNCPGPLFGKLL